MIFFPLYPTCQAQSEEFDIVIQAEDKAVGEKKKKN